MYATIKIGVNSLARGKLIKRVGDLAHIVINGQKMIGIEIPLIINK